jgi:hypothetical protein
MLPDLQSSILCDDVRQERNGKFMLIGLFDAIVVPQYPALFHKLCMVNRWCCGSGTFAQQTRIIKPDGELLLTGKSVAVHLPDGEATATCVEIFLNVRCEVPGTYWVEVMLEENMKLRYPLRASIAPQRPPEQGG